jgi:hypothetical protein
LPQLISFLKYKTNNLALINPRNTSKIYYYCGEIHNIKLSDRIITCNCEKKHMIEIKMLIETFIAWNKLLRIILNKLEPLGSKKPLPLGNGSSLVI